MNNVNPSRVLVVTVALALISGSRAFAQSEGRFAVGAHFGAHFPAGGEGVNRSQGPGLSWRLGHGKTGWGWKYGLSWFETDLDQPVGGSDVSLGRLTVRPFMGGYGYTRVIGRKAITAKLIGGPAFTSMTLNAAASDAYRARLGAGAVTVDSSNTFAVKPEVSVWYDVNKKVGINVSGGYIVARPNVTVQSTLGTDKRRVRADMFTLSIGAVYSIF